MVTLGGGAGIVVNGTTNCTLTTIGHDRSGELIGFTADHCGGPGSQVAAEGSGVAVGNIIAADDHYHYSVIKFDPATVTPVANFAGFAINGIGPDPASGQTACKQGAATGNDCQNIRPFLDSQPGRPTGRIHTSYQPGDDGGPVTADNLLVGMIYNGFTLVGPPNWGSTEIRVIYFSGILADANAKGGPGAGFSPIPA